MTVPSKFSSLTIALHWLVAFSLITLVGVGLYMTNTETFSLYPIHKSVGDLSSVMATA
ncbi:hypothetical protein [Vibrio paucivorans]|uniref:Cytochrome b n=1 Tax=Vibrio paucivorans TaxID=2829489 RepID=A0A9X3CIK4_9VIBR|nr:hypothetical protein [Vibrio paucivorans]MCW8336381.1 hypothetical protein [Vibrio paucivorans]